MWLRRSLERNSRFLWRPKWWRWSWRSMTSETLENLKTSLCFSEQSWARWQNCCLNLHTVIYHLILFIHCRAELNIKTLLLDLTGSCFSLGMVRIFTFYLKKEFWFTAECSGTLGHTGNGLTFFNSRLQYLRCPRTHFLTSPFLLLYLFLIWRENTCGLGLTSLQLGSKVSTLKSLWILEIKVWFNST